MTLRRELVDLVARDVPMLGDSFGAFSLMNKVVTLEKSRIELFKSAADVTEHGDAGHAFDPRTDGVVDVAGCNGLSGKVNCLLARAAHAIQRDGGDRNGEARQKDSQPADIGSLFAGLGNRTGHNVFDLGGIDA